MRKGLKIGYATIEDVEPIVEIYNQAIRSRSSTGDMDEFAVKERLDWFDQFNSSDASIYTAKVDKKVVGYVTLTPYRPGRKAMSKIAEISFYVDYSVHGKGVGTLLIQHALSDCGRLGKETLLAILLDINTPSIKLLEKFKFERWGLLPNVINFEDFTCSHLIYGKKLDSRSE